MQLKLKTCHVCPVICCRIIPLLLLLLLLCHGSQSQYTPQNPCPSIFQYQHYGDRYVGVITLPITESETQVHVKFMQHQPAQNGYFGELTLSTDEQSTLQLLRQGRPVTYIVHFPLPYVMPKLIQLTVNGNTICRGSEIGAPSTTITLDHVLRSSFRPFNAGNNNLVPIYSNNFDDNYVQNIFLPPRPAPSRPVQNPPVRGNVGSRVTPTSQTENNQNLECGQQGMRSTPLVYGGSVLSRGQYPWLAALYKTRVDGSDFVCGGSLISARTVITAAHCIFFRELTDQNTVVSLGRHNLRDANERGSQSFNVQRIVQQPEYNSDTNADADVALLILSQTVSFSEFIRPICLWNEPDNQALIAGSKGYVAGWGRTQSGNAISSVPKVVDSTIASEAECVRSLSHHSSVTSVRTLCAGNRDGTGPCVGDSGGSLMMLRNNRWYVRGVVSVGQTIQEVCDLSHYVVYCDVAKHMPWVKSNMQ